MSIKLSENIKKLRERKGITQSELAEVLLVTPQSVSRWENGLAYPDIEKLPHIACFFGVTIDSLMGVNETSLYSLSQELIAVRKDFWEDNSSENLLRYFEVLEKSIEAGSDVFLSEYVSVGEKIKKKGGLVPQERIDSVYETARGRLLEMLPFERQRKLVTIVINEDEDNLERWSDLVNQDNTFACWNDYLLNRYLHKNDNDRFLAKRCDVIFEDLSKLLYLVNQKNASYYYLGMRMSEDASEVVENCLLVKDIINTFSKRDDDIFIYHRITAESRLMASYIKIGDIDRVCGCIDRVKELITVAESCVGKTLTGSVKLFADYTLCAESDRFDRAMFDIDGLVMTQQLDSLNSDDERITTFGNYIENVHSKIDPFYYVDNRVHFEKLYDIVKQRAEKSQPKYMEYTMAVETAKGNIYEAEFPESTEATKEFKEFLEMLKLRSDTQIKYCVGFLCDSRITECLEIPSAYIREALCELDKRNLDMEILLQGLHSYIVQKNRVTLSPSIQLKFS